MRWYYKTNNHSNDDHINQGIEKINNNIDQGIKRNNDNKLGGIENFKTIN